MEQSAVTVRLPRAMSSIEVTHVGDQTNLSYSGHNGFQRGGQTIHYVSIGDKLMVGGTLAELREMAGELGLILAEAERDILRPEVDHGHHLAFEQNRRLA